VTRLAYRLVRRSLLLEFTTEFVDEARDACSHSIVPGIVETDELWPLPFVGAATAELPL
jgi:hypothetical protein